MAEIQPVASAQLIVNSQSKYVVQSTNIEGESKVVEKTFYTLDYYDKYGNIKTVNETRILDYLV